MIKFKNHFLYITLAALMATQGLCASQASQVVEAQSYHNKLTPRTLDKMWYTSIDNWTPLLEDIVNIIGAYASDKFIWSPTQTVKVPPTYSYFSDTPSYKYESCHALFILTDNRVAVFRQPSIESSGYNPQHFPIAILDGSGVVINTLYGMEHLRQLCAELDGTTIKGNRIGAIRCSTEPFKAIYNTPKFTFDIAPFGNIVIEVEPGLPEDCNTSSCRKKHIKNILVSNTIHKSVKIPLPSCNPPIKFLCCVAKDKNTFLLLIKDRDDITRLVTYSKHFRIDYINKQDEDVSKCSQNSYLNRLLTKAPYLPHALAAGSAALGLLSAYRWYRNASPREVIATASGAAAAGLAAAALKLYRNR
jgi:hypothetical protein